LPLDPDSESGSTTMLKIGWSSALKSDSCTVYNSTGNNF
jgi:hypothetical protein